MLVRRMIWLFAAVCCFVAGHAFAQTAVVVSDRPVTVVETMQNDASLADVAFVDRNNGWAVGDRGVIWHTAGGGATWQRQSSGVTCSLSAVSFVDAHHGWVTGGEVPPLSNSSRGVLLSTSDGGATWTELDETTLPAIRRLRFFDALHGIAAGDSSPLFPSGVVITKDGGKTWQPLPTDTTGQQWLAADFPDPHSAAFAGAKGRSATLMRGRVVNSTAADDSLRTSHALRLLLPTDGWLVGDGGRVMTTRDLGTTWQTPPGELPEVARDNFDFQAIAASGPQVWIAGSPGTRILRSTDSGQTWKLVPTGQNAPLRAISFVDAEIGFAVGDLGTILCTTDGGRSWKLQRRGGERAALLVAMPREIDVPLELVGKLGAEEGYFTAVSLLHPALPATDARTPGAMLAAGAVAVDATWRFPLSSAAGASPAELLDELNRASDGRAAERIQNYLVRQLRMWRPDVVVTPCIAEPDKHPLSALVEQFVNQAIVAAADPNQHPAISDELGLTPWQVKKVYGMLPAGWRGDDHVTTGEFAPRLGASLADWVEPARRSLSTDTSAPDSIELQLKWSNESAQVSKSRGVFDGLQLAPGGEARRRLANLPTDDVEKLRRLAMRRRQMRKLIEHSQGNEAWAAQLAHLTDDLDPTSAGELMYELADGYRSAGRLDMAADTYAALARQWPDHPLSEPALRWLVQFYASSEMALRLSDRSATNYRAAVEPEQPQFSDMRQASAVEMLKAKAQDATPVIALSNEDRLQRAAAVGQYLEKARPAMFAEP
ncbi:MAG: YCF48-related protein, partial [Pirellulales bacterium]